MFNEEFNEWQCEQAIMEGRRWCPEKTRKAFNPHEERLFKRRTYLRGNRRWNKETPSYKKIVATRVKTKYRITDEEDQSHPLQKEYWTRGWESW